MVFSTPKSHRFLSVLLLISLLANLAPMGLVAQALDTRAPDAKLNSSPGGSQAEVRDLGRVETRYDLVAIVVDEATWGATATDGGGFLNFFGGSPRISQKIDTYARDVQTALPWTKTLILTVDSNKDPVQLQKTLERLYFEGDPNDSSPTRLKGVVLVGDVPLPVVNKGGQRFLSLLPYTDFEEPRYVVDPYTQDFVLNPKSQGTQAEVWHGVIHPPVQGQEGIDLLGAYFDKNHAYHQGDEAATTFDKRVFMGDFRTESDTLNSVSFASYQRWTDLWEELAYSRYSKELVADLYGKVLGATEPGDGLDNDKDGRLDEEAKNQEDEDGDGLVDEDLGDGFYGIDNDDDGAVDEDGFEDNNNDADWVHTTFIDSEDPDAAERAFGDTQVDEDPPGDMNKDGCPGTCGQELPGLTDHDEDGYPSAWEILYGFDPFDERKPFMSVDKKVDKLYPEAGIDPSDPEGEAKATEFLKQWLTDTMYGDSLDSSCSAGGTPHPEWDDDGDFFCDEDGSDQIQPGSTCAYNDADCDGKLDEDSAGFAPQGRFDLLPDIQAKKLVETMTNPYSDIFQKPQGVWNRLVGGTGRYATRDYDGEHASNAYDSSVSLIATKDDYVLQYLRAVNDSLEAAVDEIVEKHLAGEIPLVAMMKVDAEVDGSPACDSSAPADAGADACLQFFNQSYNLNSDPLYPSQPPESYANFGSPLFAAVGPSQVKAFGETFANIDEVNTCSVYAGTAEEGGKVVEYNGLYSTEQDDDKSAAKLKNIRDKQNCTVDNRGYKEDIPGLCTGDIARDPIRAEDGAKTPEDVDLTKLDTGFKACFDFREMASYRDYYTENNAFNFWLSKHLRRFRKSEQGSSAEGYADFLQEVEEERASIGTGKAGDFEALPPRAAFKDLDLLGSDPARRYTLEDLYRDLGHSTFTDNDLDVFMGLLEDKQEVVVKNPRFGQGTSDVEELRFTFDKRYLQENPLGKSLPPLFAETEGPAKKLNSVYKHKEPTVETLNLQAKSMATPDLPVDATRRISFMDKNQQEQVLNYVNVFDAQTVADVQRQVDVLAENMNSVYGGGAFDDDVLASFEDINQTQLEDALAWRHMNTDEKHSYLFSHYLGPEEPVIAKAREGYEIVSLIADGGPDRVAFGFNGAKPGPEEDLDFQIPPPPVLETQSDLIQPISLFKWIPAMGEWLKDLSTSVSSFQSVGQGETVCGDASSTLGREDSNGNGLPDGAEATRSFELSSEDMNILQAKGQDYYTLTVSAKDADGRLNTLDNTSEVELKLLSGQNSVEPQGSTLLKLTGGMAHFVLKSKDPGAFSVQVNDSNVLSGVVTNKLVTVSTYVSSSEGEGEASTKLFTKDLPADGNSSMVVRAEIRDQNKGLATDDSQSVIAFTLSSTTQGTLSQAQVKVTRGVAETSFKVSKSAGEVEVKAQIVDGSLPMQSALIQVLPGDAVRVGLSGDSQVLPAGGEAVASLTATLYDSFGNIANNGFRTVTLESNGGVQLLDLRDEDSNKAGVQVTTPDGRIYFRALASSKVGPADIIASLDGQTDGASRFTIDHIDSLRLSLAAEVANMPVGGSTPQNIVVQALDATGQLVSAYQGEIQLQVDDQAHGNFETQTVRLSGGQARVPFYSGTLAGPTALSATSEGLQGGSLSLLLTPGPTKSLKVRKEDNGTSLFAGKPARFFVDAYDAYGNAATTDQTTQGLLRLTPATESFGSLSQANFRMSNGSAEFSLIPAHISGRIALVASAEGVQAATWQGDIEFSIPAQSFAGLQPNMLYASLLGAAFGKSTEPNYVGGWLTFNGTTQAVSSLLDDPNPKKQRASVGSQGGITLAEDSLLAQSVAGAAGQLPVRIQWSNLNDGARAADLFYVFDPAKDRNQMELLTQDPSFSVEQKKKTWLLRQNAVLVAKVREDGQIEVLDPSLHLSINGLASQLSFLVMKNTEEVARIDFTPQWDQNVVLLAPDFDLQDWATQNPGIYIKPSLESQPNFLPIFTGNSSAKARGLALIDPNEELAENLKPNAGEAGGNGWENQSKNLLLFSAGNTVGESNLYNASEIGVVLGDPTIELSTPNESNALGYTADIGAPLYTSDEDILDLVSLDANGDGKTDILVAHADGRIDLVDEGPLLFVEKGLRSVQAGDFNQDGLDDLLVISKTACLAKEMCLYLYTNQGGTFTAQNLTFDAIDAQPQAATVADLNQDGYPDVVLTNENGKVYVLWNNEGTLEDVDLLKDFGLRADPQESLAGDLALHFPGLVGNSIQMSVPVEEASLPGPAASAVTDFLASLGGADFTPAVDGSTDEGKRYQSSNLNFEKATQAEVASAFRMDKRIKDSDGGRLELGDSVEYTITLSNTSGQTVDGIYLTDTLPDSFQMDSDAVTCASCGSADDEAQVLPGSGSRPWVFGPLRLTAGQSVLITSQAQVVSLPQVQVMVSAKLLDDLPQDDFLDIGITPEGNTTGAMKVFYSDGSTTQTKEGDGLLGFGDRSYERVNYVEQDYEPTPPAPVQDSSLFPDDNANGIPDFVEAMQNMDPEVGIPVPTAGSYDAHKELLGAEDVDGDGYYASNELFKSNDDSDGDGLVDTIDTQPTPANLLVKPEVHLDLSVDPSTGIDLNLDLGIDTDAITKAVQDVVSSFTCGGGCLALAGSVAFLAPGDYHDPNTGMSLGTDQGTPIFGIMGFYPSSIVCTGSQCSGSLAMRMYLAPTTTLGLGMAVCLGPYQAGQCFAFNIPILQALGICDVMNGFLSDNLSKASSYVSQGTSSVFNVSVNTAPAAASGVKSNEFSEYKPPMAKANTSVQIPGFPSIFTEWWKAEKFELLKMLDLPDITFIYPAPESFSTEFQSPAKKQRTESLDVGVLGMEKLVNYANALPLINVHPEPVYIHYPAITQEEIEAVRQNWQNWASTTRSDWENFQSQIEASKDNLSQPEVEYYDNLNETIEEALSAVEGNMAAIESYGEIPEQIMVIRELEVYYAKIIVCYLDAILSYTAGYLTENVARIQAWSQFIVDLKDIVKGWQVLIDASVDLMDSCDKCTNQRNSGYQFLLNLFVFVPEFPVVKLPKLPDIVIDVSHIQVGVDIVWPDIHFVPETVDLPELPKIQFPNVNADAGLNIDLTVPDINIPVLPRFDMDFTPPELPGLPLPQLPDLPPAPKIPEIDKSIQVSVDVMTSIFRIVCILRNGLIPTQESKLKAQIETLTERPADFVLSADLNKSVEWPAFDFDTFKRVEITTYLNLTTDFMPLYNAVAALGGASDKFTGSVVSGVEDGLGQVSQLLEKALNPFPAPDVNLDLQTDVNLDLSQAPPLLTPDNPLVSDHVNAFTASLAQLQSELNAWDAEMPDSYNLVATQTVLGLDDPLLNRYDSIAATGGQLDPQFLASIEGTPLAGLAQLRDSLLAHVEAEESTTRALAHMDDKSFFLALEQEANSTPYALASQDETQDFSTAEDWDLSKLTPAEEAGDIAWDPEVILSEAAEETSATVNQGLMIYDSTEGVATPLIDYKAESKKDTHILFVDKDGDGDEDIVYSMGGDVYFKENHTRRARPTHSSADPAVHTLDDLMPSLGSVHNVRLGQNGYESASLSFDGNPDASAYEVLLYDSMTAAQAKPDENVKRILLLNEVENTSVPEVPQARPSRLWVDRASGKSTLFNGYERMRLSTNTVLDNAEDLWLETLSETLLTLRKGDETQDVQLPAHHLFKLGRQSGRTLKVESGSVIQIKEGTLVAEQSLIPGMSIFPEERIHLDSPAATVSLLGSDGVQVLLDKEEWFVMDALSDPLQANLSFEIENGSYVSRVRSLNPNGIVGTLSSAVLLSPQVCADSAAPFPIVDVPGGLGSSSQVDIPIFSTTTLSATASFDRDSAIVSAYWDEDASIDVDGDGEANNDIDARGLLGEIGPYDSLGERTVTLWITDAVGNEASTTVQVNVYLPSLELTEASSTAVLGTSKPLSPNFPYTLVRSRDGAVTELGGSRLTTEDGLIDAKDLEVSGFVNFYNQDGLQVAQFNPKTKQLIVSDARYEAEALPAQGAWPTRLIVREKSTKVVLGSVLIVNDDQSKILRVNDSLDKLDLSTYDSVTFHALDNQDAYVVTANGVIAKDPVSGIDFQLDPNGNAMIFDPELELHKRSAKSLDEYLILDLYRGDALEAEFWLGSGPQDTEITTTDQLNLPASSVQGTRLVADQSFRLSFEDIAEDDPLFESIHNFVERGIVEGVERDGKRYFLPDEAINRAEFTKIILGTLCIVPGEEAKVLPEVFYDILDPTLWYYPFTKEASLQGLINGYQGELNDAGLSPFKPNATITRAEASKIILEALELKGVLTLPSLAATPWYATYLDVAQDLSPYLKVKREGKESFLLTAKEARDPNHLLTRYEFIEMAARVLDAYNCFELDSDQDGLSNFDEESVTFTDPYRPDTDLGGVKDGDEVQSGLDPLNPNDDLGTDSIRLDPGVYVVQEACSTCPCLSYADWSGDLHSGDSVFAIIKNALGDILGVSNTLQIP